MKVSECCSAPVRVRSSWANGLDAVTNWYECSNCHQPCDTIEKEGEGDELLSDLQARP